MRLPHRARRAAAVAAALLAGLGLVATAIPATAAAPAANSTVDVRLISFNDLHGNLEPPSGSSGEIELDDGSTVEAGGAAYLATHVKRLREEVRNSVLLSTGDSIGASPVASALFHDEPTVEFLNKLGVQASTVGNHEFDEGYRELRRMQFGGCHREDGCQFRPTFTGARFPFLGANVSLDRPGREAPRSRAAAEEGPAEGPPALRPFTVKFSGGVPVGVIGTTLKDVPTLVAPEAAKGLKFGDEARAINRTADLLDRLGIRSQVVLLHQGDATETGGPNDCQLSPNGPAGQIAAKASAKVDAIFTGHSHEQYSCSVADPAGKPRPVIQGASFGRLLSVVDLKIDRRTRDVVRSATKARNEIVTRTVAADPAVTTLIDEAKTKAAPIANRQVGTISGDLLREGGTSGESPLGNVIADAQLSQTRESGAQVAITNPGGIRTDLLFASSPEDEGDGVVTYGEAFAAQPFANVMQTITLTGADLKAVLEQQFELEETTVLQVSDTLRYSYSTSAPAGQKVSDITVEGKPVDPATEYRVAVNNFLAAGGDGFTAFGKGTNVTGGPVDLDALIAYLGENQNVAPPPTDRITVLP